MAVMDVQVREAPVDRFAEVIGTERVEALRVQLDALRAALDGRRVWHVNSTASGGGVAEMLHVLLAYERAAGIDVRWVVVGGDAAFFATTKRLHNRLHGDVGDSQPLSATDRAHYEAITSANAAALHRRVRPGDLVVLHDPQTAGLAWPLAASGARVVWRCHIGADLSNGRTREAWAFLRRYLVAADLLVFSRQAHVPAWVNGTPTRIVAPCIDPFSPKNAEMDADAVEAVLTRVGLIDGKGGSAAPRFPRADGGEGELRRPAEVVREGPAPPPDVPLIVQVSRWDRLKDMLGVLRAFADHASELGDAHLALVGPSVAGVSDDPEGLDVLSDCLEAWRQLPEATRRRVQLVSLPMDDLEENATMVNAVQRHASVIVQKSLAEGFGLTVSEGMWKARPVVASGVGGIQDQIVPRQSGVLVDPADLDGFAAVLSKLLADAELAAELGRQARARVAQHFLGDRHLRQMADLAADLLG